MALKGVGRAFIANLLAEREKHGLFADFMDFCDRLFDQDMNRRVIESLSRMEILPVASMALFSRIKLPLSLRVREKHSSSRSAPS